MRTKLLILAAVFLLGGGMLFWHPWAKPPVPVAAIQPAALPATSNQTPTVLYAHNLLLRKGPDFRVYIRWIRGEMVSTRTRTNPSFDDQSSFVLEIQKGVIHVNIGDIG